MNPDAPTGGRKNPALLAEFLRVLAGMSGGGERGGLLNSGVQGGIAGSGILGGTPLPGADGSMPQEGMGVGGGMGVGNDSSQFVQPQAPPLPQFQAPESPPLPQFTEPQAPALPQFAPPTPQLPHAPAARRGRPAIPNRPTPEHPAGEAGGFDGSPQVRTLFQQMMRRRRPQPGY